MLNMELTYSVTLAWSGPQLQSSHRLHDPGCRLKSFYPLKSGVGWPFFNLLSSWTFDHSIITSVETVLCHVQGERMLNYVGASNGTPSLHSVKLEKLFKEIYLVFLFCLLSPFIRGYSIFGCWSCKGPSRCLIHCNSTPWSACVDGGCDEWQNQALLKPCVRRWRWLCCLHWSG